MVYTRPCKVAADCPKTSQKLRFLFGIQDFSATRDTKLFWVFFLESFYTLPSKIIRKQFKKHAVLFQAKHVAEARLLGFDRILSNFEDLKRPNNTKDTKLPKTKNPPTNQPSWLVQLICTNIWSSFAPHQWFVDTKHMLFCSAFSASEISDHHPPRGCFPHLRRMCSTHLPRFLNARRVDLAAWLQYQLSHEKNPYYFPLYWLVNRDPYNGWL